MAEAEFAQVVEDDNDFTDDASTFGDRIVVAREALGLAPADLARKLGIKLETLENWENDRAEPRANKLQMLAGLLNVPIIWLMSGSGEHGLDGAESGAHRQELIAELRKVRELHSEIGTRLSRLERKLLSGG